MKVNGNGQGKILTRDELRCLFDEGLRSPRDKALFGLCIYTSCRISEALALQDTDIKGGFVTFRKATTKSKLRTRAINLRPGLEKLLDEYEPASSGILFRGNRRSPILTRFRADKILRSACSSVGLVGVSTHSFRRTALTMMSNAGVPLRVIQEISGHNNLRSLQLYLEVTQEQINSAVSNIVF